MKITEALSEIKTLQKRIADKEQFVNRYMARLDKVRDPLEKDGGSQSRIDAEIQAIGDLEQNIVSLRTRIQRTNQVTTLTVNGTLSSATKTITEWLAWKKEIAPRRRQFLDVMIQNVAKLRAEVSRMPGNPRVLAPGQVDGAQPDDVLVYLDERKLSEDKERMTETLGLLDGQLSMLNATTEVVA